MGTQIRPLSGSGDSRFYNPERDIAHITIPTLEKVFRTVAGSGIPPAVRAFMDHHHLSREDLLDQMVKFGQAFRSVDDPKIGHLDEAIEQIGFDATQPAFAAMAMLFGTLLLGYGYRGMKGTIRSGERAPPTVEQMILEGERLLAASRTGANNELPPPGPCSGCGGDHWWPDCPTAKDMQKARTQ